MSIKSRLKHYFETEPSRDFWAWFIIILCITGIIKTGLMYNVVWGGLFLVGIAVPDINITEFENGVKDNTVITYSIWLEVGQIFSDYEEPLKTILMIFVWLKYIGIIYFVIIYMSLGIARTFFSMIKENRRKQLYLRIGKGVRK